MNAQTYLLFAFYTVGTPAMAVVVVFRVAVAGVLALELGKGWAH